MQPWGKDIFTRGYILEIRVWLKELLSYNKKFARHKQSYMFSRLKDSSGLVVSCMRYTLI